jgi:hypothetical protein
VCVHQNSATAKANNQEIKPLNTQGAKVTHITDQVILLHPAKSLLDRVMKTLSWKEQQLYEGSVAWT